MEENLTIRVVLQMSTLLADAVIVMIGLGCVTKNIGICKRTKNTSGHVHQGDSQNEEQNQESKCDDKGVEKRLLGTELLQV